MGFTLDFNDTFDNSIEDGTYEVVVWKVGEDATKNGAEFIQFDLIIRNDVQQKYQNSHIFHKVWKSKDTNKYNPKSFNLIAKVSQLQNGKTYGSLNELCADFAMHTCKITVKNEESTFNGNTYNNLNVKRWEETTFMDLNHQFKESANPFGDKQPVVIDEDDLPF